MAELTQLTGGSKPPVMRVHSDQAGEFLSPVVMEWLKQHNIKQTLLRVMTLLKTVLLNVGSIW